MMRVRIVIVLPLVLAGCAAEQSPNTESESLEQVSDTVAAKAETEVENFQLAVNEVDRPLLPASIRTGRLLVEDQCILFETGGTKYLPVWPAGSSVEDHDGKTVVRMGNTTVSVDDTQVQLGGGPVDRRNTDIIKFSEEIARKCPFQTFGVGSII